MVIYYWHWITQPLIFGFLTQKLDEWMNIIAFNIYNSLVYYITYINTIYIYNNIAYNDKKDTISNKY